MIAFSRTGRWPAQQNPSTESNKGSELGSHSELNVTVAWLIAVWSTSPVTRWCAICGAIGLLIGVLATLALQATSLPAQRAAEFHRAATIPLRNPGDASQTPLRLELRKKLLQDEVDDLSHRQERLERKIAELTEARSKLLIWEGALPRFRTSDGQMHEFETWPPIADAVGRREFVWVHSVPDRP